MAAVVNARDVLLQAAPTRTTVFPDAAILLGASTNAFHVANGGAFDPSSITIRATLISIEGVVTFNATGCTLTGISGNSATLTYANMPSGAASITASLTVGGVTVTSNSLILTKIFDGAPGAPGAPGSTGNTGARGAGHFYAPGSAWSDAAADAATPGGNVVDDVVTISNGATFVSSKRWSGSAWGPVGVVIDGSLVVEQSLTAAAMNTNGLTVRAPDGTLILSSGGLNSNYAAAGTRNSDIRLGGRNFFLSSQAVSEVNNNVGTGVSSPRNDEAVPYHRITSTPGTVISTYTAIHQWQKIPLGTQVVISCDVRAPVAGNVGFYSAQGMQAVPANKWVRISYVFTYDGVSRVPGHTYAESNTLDYRNYKVEIGNIATDWSPAPEDVDTSIAATADQAALANAEIANITSDNVLSRDDKSAVILQFTAIAAEIPDIVAKADAAGVSRTAFYNSYIELNNYLPVGWNDTSTNTSIVGTTFRSMFASYYNQRQLLINATVAAAATTALWDAVTGPRRPSDNATSDMILIQDGIGLVVAGNNISRPTNGGTWNAGVWSSDSYAGGAFVSARIGDAGSHFMFGLNTDPVSNNSFDTLDWSIYCAQGTVYVYESGFNPGSYGGYAVGDTFAVTYDGVYVRYLKNGAVFRTVAVVITAPLHFDSSFNSSGGSLTNVRFGPLSTAIPGLKLEVSGGGIKVQGSTVSRTGGSTWDASVRSTDGHTGGAACSFVPQPGAHYMMGLNTDPATDDSYGGIDYCFYDNANGFLIGVIAGSQYSLGSYVPGQDVLSIVYDNSCVAWAKNGVVLKTVPTVPGQKFHLDSSIVDGTISSIRFGPMSANAVGSVWLNSSGVVVLGGVFKKVSTSSGWDEQVYSAEGYTGGAYARATIRAGSCMFGLESNPSADATYTGLDFAIYCDGANGVAAYESGIGYSLGTYANGDAFLVRYNGSNVQYCKNGNVIRTIAAGPNLKFHFDSSFQTSGTVLEGAEFGPMSDVSAGVSALSGLADKLNKAGADTISGPISLTAANAILVGTTNDGIFYGSTGIYGRKAGFTTFSVAADGTALFGGALVAATGTFGSVTIAAGGSISSGQTAYATGTGWWMGSTGGVPKFSIGDASQYVRWTGTALEVKLNQIVLGTLATLSSPSGANGTRVYGTRTVSITSGGTSPFTYNWYMSSNYLGRITLSGTTTATVTVSGTATNDGTSGILVCVVTDANGLSATASCSVSATHGSPP